MKKIFLVLVVVASTAFAQQTKNVLFVGNSITYFNNMPQTFKQIADSKGDLVDISQHTPGGTGFVDHVANAALYTLIKSKTWDFVVLQPGSGESAAASFPIATTLGRAEKLRDSVLKYSPCAKILFYEISNGVWGSTPANLQTYNSSMDNIRTNLETLADGAQLPFAPVGEAFRAKWNDDQTDMLWGSTGNIHPNAKGSYIAACVFYATMFQKKSEGTSAISSLAQADATAIQILADDTVLNHKADWRINTFNQYTNFDFTVSNNEVTFTNNAVNIDSFEWSFGDGNTSTTTNPVHQYATTGDFTVTLTTHSGTCDEVVTKTITVQNLSVADNALLYSENIYPNPTSNYLQVDVNTDAYQYEFKVYDITGKFIERYTTPKLDVSKLAKGLYVLKINNLTTHQSSVKKWIKK